MGPSAMRWWRPLERFLPPLHELSTIVRPSLGAVAVLLLSFVCARFPFRTSIAVLLLSLCVHICLGIVRCLEIYIIKYSPDLVCLVQSDCMELSCVCTVLHAMPYHAIKRAVGWVVEGGCAGS